MNCPSCDKEIGFAASCGCGWRKPKAEKAVAGPDYARMTADRQRSIDRLFEPYTGPRACQERTCPKRAVPGLEFCDYHAQLPEEQVRRVGIPKDWKKLGDFLK